MAAQPRCRAERGGGLFKHYFVKDAFRFFVFFFFYEARIEEQSRKTEKRRKTRNENSPLLGREIEKFGSTICCSRDRSLRTFLKIALGVPHNRSPPGPGSPPGRVKRSDEN